MSDHTEKFENQELEDQPAKHQSAEDKEVKQTMIEEEERWELKYHLLREQEDTYFLAPVLKRENTELKNLNIQQSKDHINATCELKVDHLIAINGLNIKNSILQTELKCARSSFKTPTSGTAGTSLC